MFIYSIFFIFLLEFRTFWNSDEKELNILNPVQPISFIDVDNFIRKRRCSQIKCLVLKIDRTPQFINPAEYSGGVSYRSGWAQVSPLDLMW